jgi:hypothetical protein
MHSRQGPGRHGEFHRTYGFYEIYFDSSGKTLAEWHHQKVWFSPRGKIRRGLLHERERSAQHRSNGRRDGIYRERGLRSG